MFIFKVGRFLYKSCFVLFTYKLKATSAVWVAEQGGWPGCSRIARTSSHLARTDGADATVEQDAWTGDSGFARLGSHLAEMDAAEGRAGQVEGLGSSGFVGNGSHLAAADFSDEPEAVLWRRPPSRRTESGLLSYGTASPDSSVQKTALWRTRGSS